MFDIAKIDQVHKLSLRPEWFGGFSKSYIAALGPGDVPEYQDFILQDKIVPLLTIISVLGFQEPDCAQYRYCGSAVVDQIGTDLTGLDLLDMVPSEGREGLYTDMKAMLEYPCGNFSQHIDLYSGGKSMKSDSLALPLRSRSDSGVDLLITLHASEWTNLAEGQKQALLREEEVQIGIDWVQSIFVDLGNGTPGPTNLQRTNSSANQ